MLTSKGERITADSDEAAPSFRVIAPPDCGMTSPWAWGLLAVTVVSSFAW